MSHQAQLHKTRAEIEELKEFRKFHRANCCVYFLHLGLLSLLFLLFVAWQVQTYRSTAAIAPSQAIDDSQLVFDPETQEYINPNGNSTTANWREMSMGVVLRDFIRSAFGMSIDDQYTPQGGFAAGQKQRNTEDEWDYTELEDEEDETELDKRESILEEESHGLGL
ncbi:hypothetical protein FGO68_gene2454 [Halteria grandinella]|uniref:Uncharacterized protein n=1 Tax=Halteria grandinella TaxID=5974 RepID=A0A8J8NTV8_HALGN|nr:hypothetical protein FGO68_gene2454 [Halteria grandinella]